MNTSVFRCMCVIACAILFTLSLWGQQTMTNGGVTGRVTDQTGAAVPDASVTLVDRATNTAQTVQTNTDGLYVFNNVPAGAYDLTVTKSGFRKTVISNQTVTTGTVLTLNATLQVGATSETVEVTATVGAELQTENATMGTSITGSAVLNLPTINRDVSGLMFYQPTAAPTNNGAENNIMSGQVAGNFADQNTYLLDGGINTSDLDGDNATYVSRNGAGVMPTPAESVEEFRVNTNNETPDFGLSQGGQVMVTTKRGSNSFHGSAYDFFQADWLNSNDWYNNFLGVSKPKAHFNRFGGALGGPLTPHVLGGKTYFYVNYEGQRYPRSGPYTALVPSATLRAGIIQERDASGGVVAYNVKDFDPLGIGLNPVVSTLWNKYMPPCNTFSIGDKLNTCGFFGDLTFPLSNDFGVVRIDHDFGSNWRFFSSYRYYRQTNPTTSQVDIGGLLPGDTLGQPASASTNILRPRFFVVGLTGTISPTLTNDFHASYLDNAWQWLRAGATPQIPGAAGALEIGGESRSNELIPVNTDTQDARARLWLGHDYDYRDNLTKLAGTHLFQFGGEFFHQHWRFDRYDNVVGGLTSLVYNISNTGQIAMSPSQQPTPCTAALTTGCLPATQVGDWNNLYAQVLGLVQSTSVVATRVGANLALQPLGSPVRSNVTDQTWSLFFNDTWKIKPNLTLSYGLNYQMQYPPVEANGEQDILTTSAGDILTTSAYLNARYAAAINGGTYAPTIGFTPIGDVKAALGYPYAPFYGAVAPRVSIAWNPNPSGGWLAKLLGDKATVIRVGYGRFYSRNLGIDLVSTPVLGDGFLQPVGCTNPTTTSACTGTGGTNPSNAFRIGINGLTPPVGTIAPTLTPPVEPGVGTTPFAILADSLDYNFQPGRTNTVDFSIQRQFKGNLILELGYVGNYSNHLYQGIDLNDVPWMMKLGGQTFAQAFDNLFFASKAGAKTVAPQPFFESALGGPGSAYCTGFASCTQAVYTNEASNIGAAYVTNLWSDLDSSFAFGPQLLSTTQCFYCYTNTSLGFSNYNALTASLTKRSSDLVMSANFTYSHALGTIGINQAYTLANVNNPWDLNYDYGNQAFDRRYTFNLLASYTLPGGKSSNWFIKEIVGGWTISPILSISSGLPLIIYSADPNVSGVSDQNFGNGFDGNGCDAVPLSSMSYSTSMIGGQSATGIVGANENPTNGGFGINMFGNPAAVYNNFRPALPGIDTTCGGQGLLRGQWRWNLDLGLTKNFAITERAGIEFYAQAFNVLNHMEWNDPYLALQDPADFGVPNYIGTVAGPQYNALALGSGGGVSGANYTRIIQLGVRIHF